MKDHKRKRNIKNSGLLLFILLTLQVVAQERKQWVSNGYINAGATFNINMHGKEQKFPGIKGFIGFAVSNRYGEVLVNYGVNVAVYHKTIGASLSPLENDLQVDFTNAFTLGYVNQDINHTKYIYTLHNSSFYNLAIRSEYGVFASTHFVLNNHRRNQAVGAITLTGKDVTLNYYNDGAVPFNILGIADNFDRWWTGGGTIFCHSTRNYNYAELGFDQFTGYKPLLYEMSGILGIRIPSYNWKRNYMSNDERASVPSYNTSEYRLRVFLGEGIAVETGVMGSMRYKDWIYGVQDMIHKSRSIPYHPNNDINRWIIGGSYNNTNHVRF